MHASARLPDWREGLVTLKDERLVTVDFDINKGRFVAGHDDTQPAI
jgi:hypothetical protein